MNRSLLSLRHAGYDHPCAPIPQEFTRLDEQDDSLFYERDRFVQHLDSTALEAVEKIIKALTPGPGGRMLDLMASWDSHIPPDIKPDHMAGLGLNPRELAQNPILDSRLVQDLNQNPVLPLDSASFDQVNNIVSVEYLTDPIAVFKEVGRVLKPGGRFLIIFSNRFFEPKVTAIWRRSSESQRIALVETWLAASEAFNKPSEFIVSGLPRPADDKYTRFGIPSDPVFAVYADKMQEAVS